VADALGAHERALLSGGRPGIRDLDQVLSAIGRPYHGYHRRIEAKAAALMEAVATSHGFVDGNKRTAIILTHLLLEGSGYTLMPKGAGEDLERALEDFILSVVAHEYSFDQMIDWFKARIKRL